jgi:DNA polymerase
MVLPENQLLLDSVRDYLDQIRQEGMDGLPMTGRPATLPPILPGDKPVARTRKESTIDTLARVEPAPEMNSTAARYPGIENTGDLASLRDFIGDCTRCKLHGGRTNLVFGVGDPNADLMFIGEGPGADEDAKGEPFVGRAGQLLTDIIERGMGLKRSQVYICNVVKCRPPENRNPEPDEVLACEPFLFRQIEIVKPRVIVGLGAFAVQCVLRLKTPISKLRGNWHEVRGIKMMPTFHPAYLLRNPGDKRLVWSDIQEVMKSLGLPIAGRGNA